MDLNRIFMKNASPTKVGGQAVMEGLMMRGSRALAIAMRKPDGDIHLAIQPLPAKKKIAKIPVIRGIYSFIDSLATGTGILMYSADQLEKFETPDGEPLIVDDKFTLWLKKHFSEKTANNILLYSSVVLAVIMTVGLFVILPTFIMNLLKNAGIESVLLLNLIEGLMRICMFIAYVTLISKMDEIKTVFRYHGAEHKTIHCYENGLELTPENAQSFYTLHPRCGTSFLMFVMVISLLVFSLFGWPDLKTRVISRLVMIPIIAGLSYELLQFTGRHDGKFVKILSMPGILLQKLTTAEPDLKQLEVAIAAMNAVLPSQNDPDLPVDYWVGTLHADGTLEKDEEATLQYKEEKEKK